MQSLQKYSPRCSFKLCNRWDAGHRVLAKDLVRNKALASKVLGNKERAVKDSAFPEKVAPVSVKVEPGKEAKAGPVKKDKAKGAPGQAMEAELEKDDDLRKGHAPPSCCPQQFSSALSSNCCPQQFRSA
jgi:hypothetical protein